MQQNGKIREGEDLDKARSCPTAGSCQRQEPRSSPSLRFQALWKSRRPEVQRSSQDQLQLAVPGDRGERVEVPTRRLRCRECASPPLDGDDPGLPWALPRQTEPPRRGQMFSSFDPLSNSPC